MRRPGKLISYAGAGRAIVLLVAGASLALHGCTRTPQPAEPGAEHDASTVSPAVPAEIQSTIDRYRALAAQPDNGVSQLLGSSQTDNLVVELPRNSVNGLAAAIAAAGSNGTVIVKSGSHSESGTVAVQHPVSIIGEPGAVINSSVPPTVSTTQYVVIPAIYVHGAGSVRIWNVRFQSTLPNGGTAILLENAPGAIIGCNRFDNFQWSTLMQNAPSSYVVGNTMNAAPGWATGDIPESEGAINVNGDHVVFADNTIRNGLMGLFISGGFGVATGNSLSGNYFCGLLLCKIPYESFLLPSGAEIGSEVSAHEWLIIGNRAFQNIQDGFLAVDGSNHNLLVENAASNNGLYDIELAGATFRFGFCVPTSFSTKVIAGPHSGLTVNNWGQNNTVVGGVQSSTVVVPCP